MDSKNIKYSYILIFRGRSCIEVRIDNVPQSYISKLRKIKLSKDQIKENLSINYVLYEKVLNEMYADELHMFGMGDHGLIQVYQNFGHSHPPIDKMGNVIYEDDGISKLKVETVTPIPRPKSTIVACLCAQDGVMGHIDLELKEAFNPAKLTLILTSGDAFLTDSAITGIKYDDEGSLIEATINSSEYLLTYPKAEIFFCSDYDENGKEIPLFEDGEWVQNPGK